MSTATRAAATAEGDKGCRIDKGARRVCQPVDEESAPRGERAKTSERLPERTDLHVDFGGQPRFLDDSTSTLAEHTRRVCLVDQGPRIPSPGQVDQVFQGGDVAIHAEHRLTHDEPLSQSRCSGQQLSEVIDVEMSIHPDIRPLTTGIHQ